MSLFFWRGQKMTKFNIFTKLDSHHKILSEKIQILSNVNEKILYISLYTVKHSSLKVMAFRVSINCFL